MSRSPAHLCRFSCYTEQRCPTLPTKLHRRAGKGRETPPETDKTNTEGTHLISLSASPTLGCGINTGRYLFIASQHPNICFPVSQGHTHIHGWWMPLMPANLGTLSSAKAGEERSLQDLLKYAGISSNLTSRCTRRFLFEYLIFSSAPHILSIHF